MLLCCKLDSERDVRERAIMSSQPAVPTAGPPPIRNKPKSGARVLIVISGLLVVGVIVSSILTSHVLPAMARARREALRISCSKNLHEIGLASLRFSVVNKDMGPASFNDLYPEHISDLSVFVCPSDPEFVEIGNAEDIASWSSYVIYPHVPIKGCKRDLLAREKSLNHYPAGSNELYCDGHVELRPMFRIFGDRIIGGMSPY